MKWLKGITPVLSSPFEGSIQTVEQAQTSREVIEASGLNWRVVEKPISIHGEHEIIDTHKAIVRADTNLRLGIVGHKYHPLQNSEIFAFADSLIGEGKLEYVGAGSFNEGRRIFVQCRATGSGDDDFGPTEVADGDVVYPYFLFVNGHDGSSSVRVMNTEIRVVCQNTLNAAINSSKKKKDTSLCIRHTKSMSERLEQAKETFVWAKMNHLSWVKDAKRLVAAKIAKQAELASYFDAVFNVVPSEAAIEAERSKVQEDNRRMRLIELFESGAGNDNPAVRGSRWAAVNAVTQYLGHEARTGVRGGKSLNEEQHAAMTRQKRLESNIFGSNADIADRAFELALQ